MEQQFMKEVDEEIQKILSKKKPKVQEERYCTSKNLQNCLEEISLEFDYLDVSCMDEKIDISSSKYLKKVLIQLVNSSYNLLNLYKQSNKSQNDNFEKNSKIFNDYKSLLKMADNLKKDLDAKDRQIQINKEKIMLEKVETTDLKNKLTDAKKEITFLKKDNLNVENRHKTEMNKMKTENRVFHERFQKNCGEYVSKEGKIIQVIENYKKNEEKYLRMIQQLQENNHLLVEEIVDLKGEIAVTALQYRSE